jgi:hypothetical protein
MQSRTFQVVNPPLWRRGCEVPCEVPRTILGQSIRCGSGRRGLEPPLPQSIVARRLLRLIILILTDRIDIWEKLHAQPGGPSCLSVCWLVGRALVRAKGRVAGPAGAPAPLWSQAHACPGAQAPRHKRGMSQAGWCGSCACQVGC